MAHDCLTGTELHSGKYQSGYHCDRAVSTFKPCCYSYLWTSQGHVSDHRCLPSDQGVKLKPSLSKKKWNPLCIVGCALLLPAFTASVQQGPDPQRKLPDPELIISLLHWKLSLRQVNHRNSLPSTPHSNTSSLQMPEALLLCIAWLPPKNPCEQLFFLLPQDQASELYKSSKGCSPAGIHPQKQSLYIAPDKAFGPTPLSQLQQQMLDADVCRNKLSYTYLITEALVETHFYCGSISIEVLKPS